MQPVDFVVLGHITKDLTPDGYTIGGTVTYAAVTARNLGLRAGIVTRASLELNCSNVLAGITVVRLPSPVTSTFENIYRDGHRVQYLRARAESIRPADVPNAWRTAPIVQLGPLTQELPADIGREFPHSLVGVTPQGWLRRWDEDGRVHQIPWANASEVMAHADVLVFSREDVRRDEGLIAAYTHLAEIVVVTDGVHGADLYHRRQRTHFSAFLVEEHDPTGAGDVFAAAFLLRLHETGEPKMAMQFANCAASFCVEGPGISTIPTREQVEHRLKTGRLRGS